MRLLVGSLALSIVRMIRRRFLEELPVRPAAKAKRNSRAVNTIRAPEPPPPKSKPVSQKPPAQNAPSKPPTKAHKIVVNEKDAAVGVFMTMEEIAELVKAVKDSSRAPSNLAMESKGMFRRKISMYQFSNV